MSNSNFNKTSMNSNSQLLNNNYLTDVEESSESFRKLQEKARKNRPLQNNSNNENEEDNEEEDDEEEDDEEEEEEDDDLDEEILDDEQKSNISGFLTNLIKKVGAKSLFATGASIGGIGAIASLFVGIYRVHYNGEFEFKGIGGEYQNLSFKNMNFTSFNKSGDVELSGLTKENKLTKTYYTMYSDNSYYAIVEDSEKYSNIDDAYKRKNLLTPDELREQYPDIKDVEGREKMFQLNPDVLYSLDRYLHKNQFLYPQQFIKPVYYEESQDKFSLKQLTDENGNLTAESQLFNSDGKPLTDSKGNLKKDIGVWDYGVASVLRYKEYDVKERDVTSISGSTLKYKGYKNQNNSSDNSTVDKVVSESSIGKIDASYMPPGLNLEGTSSERDANRHAYAIDTAVTAGGTITSKVSQKWQEKEGTRKTGTKTYQFTETETKEVAVEGEQKKETQTIVHSYEIEYTYEYYVEEYIPYYEGDLDTSEITGSRYYRDYIKNYSNYIPVDVPNQLDFSVFDKNDEISALLPDDTPGQYSSGENNAPGSEGNLQLSGKTFPAEFTAYTADPKENGGYNVDAMGNKLDYTKNTCAGPIKSKYPNSELTLGSKIVINGTGTDKDGVTCTVTDTGGAIVLDSDGTYHIDILVKDKSTASKFGRRKGTITIVESGSTSSSNPNTSSSNSNTSSSNSNTPNSNSSTSGASVTLPTPREGEDRSVFEVLSIGSKKDTQPVLNSMKYFNIFQKYGEMYGIDPYLLVAMASGESSGNPTANNGHAMGIMQIEDVVTKVEAYNHETKQIEKVNVVRSQLYDPDYCIKIGAMELAERLDDMYYNILMSLQGYNYGGGGIKSTIQYYLSGGTIGVNHSIDTAQFEAYAESNHVGWITALYPGDLPKENSYSELNGNDGKHSARTWYSNTGWKKYNQGAGTPVYIERVLNFYAGDGSPWVKKPDGTIVTIDGSSASGYASGNSSAVGAFNSYLASNWNTVLNLKDDLFPWSTELDEGLKKEAKGNYSDLKNTNLLIRNKNRFISNLTNTDVDITINMMFALNQGNYLSKYDYMGEAEWKAMYNQLLSSPTGKTWDDKWIGFTCEEVFGKSLEDLGTLFKEGSGVNPSVSRPYGVAMNSITNDTAVLSQYNDMNFGIDLSLPEDTEVLALEDGEILSINKKSSPLSRYGVYVKIKYNENTIMTIANLKELDKSIKVGSKVNKGQVIGVSGGNCKSYKENDLHIELLYNGNYINPEWIITRDMNGFDDPIKGNNGSGGAICGSDNIGNTATGGVGADYVETAKNQVGKPYIYGTAGPNSFDCSGLVQWSMAQHDIHISRTSRSQRKDTARITFDQLQPGDLIFRHGKYGSPMDTNNPENVTHVMIYIGNNQYVHAPRTGKNVEIKDLKQEPGFSYGRFSGASGATETNNVTNTSSQCQTFNQTILNGGMQIPLFLQTDSKWKNEPYGAGNSRGNTIGTNGCGPTCISMIASYFTGKTILPPDVTSWAGMKYYSPGNGSTWNIFDASAKNWGYKCKQINNRNSQEILNELKAGNPIIASMGPGDFTKGGHYIVLRGVTSNDEILVNDPNSTERSQKSWNISRIISQSKAMWAFSK